MDRWKALIIDDEPLARQELLRLLEPYPEIDVRGEASSLDNAIEAIESYDPDVLFLDIDLGKYSGFDLLERVAPRFRTIFVTAFDEYAIRAFQVNALDYLLKPIHPDRLRESLERLGSPNHPESKLQLEAFDKILLSHLSYSRLVRVGDISYIEARGDYTRVHMRDGFSGTLHQTIKRWVERLPAFQFIQTHRSYIVNTDRVLRMEKKSKDSFSLVLDHPVTQVPVSRSYHKQLQSKFRIQ